MGGWKGSTIPDIHKNSPTTLRKEDIGSTYVNIQIQLMTTLKSNVLLSISQSHKNSCFQQPIQEWHIRTVNKRFCMTTR